MLNGKRLLLTAGAVALAAVMAASAATAGMSDLERRQTVMRGMAGHMKNIVAVAKGKAQAGPETIIHAQAVRELSATIAVLFPAGSGGGKSRAKPEVWSDNATFMKFADAIAAATPALVAAAKSGDAAAIGAALGGVGKNCGGCHKANRMPKK